MRQPLGVILHVEQLIGSHDVVQIPVSPDLLVSRNLPQYEAPDMGVTQEVRRDLYLPRPIFRTAYAIAGALSEKKSRNWTLSAKPSHL